MANVTRLTRPRRKYNIGQMSERVVIQERGLNATAPGDFVADLEFGKGIETWASLKTYAASEFFDGVNVVRKATHKYGIRYRPGVTAEMFLTHKGVIYDIIDVENFEERNEFLILSCNVRGSKRYETNEA